MIEARSSADKNNSSSHQKIMMICRLIRVSALVGCLLCIFAAQDGAASAVRHRRLRRRGRETMQQASSSDPGAMIAATIAKLKSTETKLRDTQASMQAAVEKIKQRRRMVLKVKFERKV